MKIFGMAITLLCTMCLTGCIVSALNIGDKTVLEVKFVNDTYDVYIVKSNPDLQRNCPSKFEKNYKVWGFSCGYNNPPNQLNLEYAKLGITFQQYHQLPTDSKRQKILENTVQSLPPSAWRTYTINPQQVIEKAKREVPARHPDNIKNYPIGKNGTIIKLTLYIDGNGNITQEIDHIIDIGWVHT